MKKYIKTTPRKSVFAACTFEGNPITEKDILKVFRYLKSIGWTAQVKNGGFVLGTAERDGYYGGYMNELLEAVCNSSDEDYETFEDFEEAVLDAAYEAGEFHGASHAWEVEGLQEDLKELKKKYLQLTDEELKPKKKPTKRDATLQIIQPAIDKILNKYTSITGLIPTIGNVYYNPSIERALIEFSQPQINGLTWYTAPGKAKPTNPAAIPADPTDQEVSTYVDRMIDALIRGIQYDYADYALARHLYHKDIPIDDDEAVLDNMIEVQRYNNRIGDESRFRNFVNSLLDSGEVVNRLPQYLDEIQKEDE